MTKHIRLTSLKKKKKKEDPPPIKQYIEFHGINRLYYQVIFLLMDVYDVLNFFLQ